MAARALGRGATDALSTAFRAFDTVAPDPFRGPAWGTRDTWATNQKKDRLRPFADLGAPAQLPPW
jgi:hypothetical protein